MLLLSKILDVVKDNKEKNKIEIKLYDPKTNSANAVWKSVYITDHNGDKCIAIVYSANDYSNLIRDLYKWHDGNDPQSKVWGVFQDADILVEDVDAALGTTIALKYSCYLNSKLRDDIDNRWLFISFKIKKLFRCFSYAGSVDHNETERGKKEWRKRMEEKVNDRADEG